MNVLLLNLHPPFVRVNPWFTGLPSVISKVTIHMIVLLWNVQISNPFNMLPGSWGGWDWKEAKYGLPSAISKPTNDPPIIPIPRWQERCVCTGNLSQTTLLTDCYASNIKLAGQWSEESQQNRLIPLMIKCYKLTRVNARALHSLSSMRRCRGEKNVSKCIKICLGAKSTIV